MFRKEICVPEMFVRQELKVKVAESERGKGSDIKRAGRQSGEVIPY